MNGRDPVTLATEVQRRAARPDVSVAVRASAGSGKTRVLIDRFVRLCVEGEHNDVHPRSILAITFTRKAATEIHGRLLARARHLALADADARRDLLADLFGGRPDPAPLDAELDRAARLYERLLEDPGGLQVGTIHSFCQRILARFAVDAGLDPHATLLEDREDLVDEAVDTVIAEMAADEDLAALAPDLGSGPGAVRTGLASCFGEQMRLDRWLRRLAREADTAPLPRSPHLGAALAELRAFLWPGETVAEDVTPANLEPALARALDAFAGPGLDAVENALDPDERAKVGKTLGTLRAEAAAAVGFDGARAVLLTKAGSVKKFTRVGGAELKARFQDLVTTAAAEVLAVLRRRDLVDLYRRNRALLRLGLRALDVLDDLKRRDRVLDFGDLEDMAVRLLGDEARALSLLFRLEDSLRHMLVDEFQDTNFNQRDILAPFAEEFLAGGGGDGAVPPTVFFVGDMKQSIYGFRGAEPGIFAGVMAMLASRGLPVETLPTNFRSLPALVDGVGGMFGVEPLVSRLPAGEAEHVHQQAARREDDGLLVVLEAYEAAEDGRTGDQVAADAAAQLVGRLMADGATTWEGWGDTLRRRPLTWSDILVLYKTRTHVSLYEQAFRAGGIPIEPAGRGMLAASREVQDVLTLLRWLVWPDDDLALATVLRSPLFRLSEALFQELLAARGLFRAGPDGATLPPAGLWTTLRARRENDPALTAAAERLEAWRADAGFVGCHELLRRIYREGHVPERYGICAGAQARINLERLHDLALGPEIAGAPTVRRFIELLDKAGRRGGQDEGTAGREDGAGRVRFMTIHGAKGLEAPVVLLVDADRAVAGRGRAVRVDPGDGAAGLLLGAKKNQTEGLSGAAGILAPDPLQVAGAAAATADDREESNLLYVALTRARDRLYVLGGRTRTRDPAEGPPATTLRRLRAAAANAPDAPVGLDDPANLERPPAVATTDRTPDTEGSLVRVWAPPSLGERPAVVAPSAVAAEEGETATPVSSRAAEHGLRVHLLLQTACALGSVPAGDTPAHREARTVFGDPRLDWIFRPATVDGRGVSEAPIIQRRPGPRGGAGTQVTGFIDRLVLRPDRVDVVDYKTNRWGGDPERRAWLLEHYRPQLTAYREVMAALHPGREIRAWLLLTDPAGRGPGETGLLEVD